MRGLLTKRLTRRSPLSARQGLATPSSVTDVIEQAPTFDGRPCQQSNDRQHRQMGLKLVSRNQHSTIALVSRLSCLCRSWALPWPSRPGPSTGRSRRTWRRRRSSPLPRHQTSQGYRPLAPLGYRQKDLFDTLANNSVDMVVDNLGFPGAADKVLRVLRTGVVYIVLPNADGSTLSLNIKTGVTHISSGLVQPNTVDLMTVSSYFDDGRACRASILSILPWHLRESPAGRC